MYGVQSSSNPPLRTQDNHLRKRKQRAVFIPRSGSGPRFILVLSGFCAELSATTQPGSSPPNISHQVACCSHLTAQDPTHSELSHGCLTRTHLRMEQGQSGVWTPAPGTEKKARAKSQ